MKRTRFRTPSSVVYNILKIMELLAMKSFTTKIGNDQIGNTIINFETRHLTSKHHYLLGHMTINFEKHGL